MGSQRQKAETFVKIEWGRAGQGRPAVREAEIEPWGVEITKNDKIQDFNVFLAEIDPGGIEIPPKKTSKS